jgi:hypothetical protein
MESLNSDRRLDSELETFNLVMKSLTDYRKVYNEKSLNSDRRFDKGLEIVNLLMKSLADYREACNNEPPNSDKSLDSALEIFNVTMKSLTYYREVCNEKFDCFDIFEILMLIREGEEGGIEIIMTIPSIQEKIELDGFTPVLFTENDQYSFKSVISSSIQHIFCFKDIPVIAKICYAYELTNTLLVTAQRRSLITGDASRIIESKFGNKVYINKKSDLYMKRLNLLDSVSLAAQKIFIDPPSRLLNKRDIWRQSIYQEICKFGKETSYKGSKLKICTELRRIGKSIRNKENPFSLEEEEMRDLIEYALSICGFLSIESLSRSDIRKDIELKLEEFHKAYTSFAGHIQRNTEIEAKSLLNGQLYAVGMNNHHRKLSVRRTYTKLPFPK